METALDVIRREYDRDAGRCPYCRVGVRGATTTVFRAPWAWRRHLETKHPGCDRLVELNAELERTR